VQHLSLACVEILVHLDKSELPRDYFWSSTESQGTLEFLQFSDLNHISSCQSAGRSWVHTGGQLAAQVPSRRNTGRVQYPTQREYTALTMD
jgi:hypothetical protein